jgi:uncharacterized protein YbbC (DUF1343 family)
MVRQAAVLIILLLTLNAPRAYASTELPDTTAVKVGLDVLQENDFKALRGKRFALITNSTGRSTSGEMNYDLFRKHNLNLISLFAPEHGFSISEEAGKKVASGKTEHGIKIYSLYGETTSPTAAMLSDIDAVVFDIQDIGTRCYTYIATMRLAMRSCALNQKAFIVLDRPNPIAPIPAQGFRLDTTLRSLVGGVQTDFVHSKTIGDLAREIQKTELPSLKLTVIEMTGYDRTRFADEYANWKNLFVPPSPNIQSVEAMLLYPATVLLEGTSVSEGRGTAIPFEQIGAPFIDAAKLKSELDKENLSGIRIDTVSFVPKSIAGKSNKPKFENRVCNGVRFVITERRSIQPFPIAAALLTALQKLYPAEFTFQGDGKFFDKLAGTKKLREMIRAGKNASEILNESRRE